MTLDTHCKLGKQISRTCVNHILFWHYFWNSKNTKSEFSKWYWIGNVMDYIIHNIICIGSGPALQQLTLKPSEFRVVLAASMHDCRKGEKQKAWGGIQTIYLLITILIQWSLNHKIPLFYIWIFNVFVIVSRCNLKIALKLHPWNKCIQGGTTLAGVSP